MTYLIYLLRNWERSNGKCCPGSRKIDLLINSGCNQRRIAKFPEPLPNIQIGSEKKMFPRNVSITAQKTTDLVTFTEEVLNGKLRFLGSVLLCCIL